LVTDKNERGNVVTMSAAEHVFREGDHAMLLFGTSDIEVEVIEERGPIGSGGRRLVRIRMPLKASESVEFELPEADLRPVTRAS
jgi:hypothetical protein